MLIQLDSNIFLDKQLITTLKKKVSDNKLKIILSPVVLLEFGYFQELRNNRQIFLNLLKLLSIQVEPIRKKDAIIAIKHSMLYKEDQKGPMYYFRDSFIAALSERMNIPVITNNTKNFKGLPRALKLTSSQALKVFKKL